MKDSLLVEIGVAGKTKDGHIKKLYLCLCGSIVEVAASRVRNGYTRSCGCLNHHNAEKKHGMRGSATYASWSSARDRCRNKNSKDFYRYGGAGIAFDKRWDDFAAFLADMGERPEGKTLDRIDPKKGYSPDNCRWATPKEQSRNRRDLIVVATPIGIMALVDYSARIGITNGAAHQRLKRGKLYGCVKI